MTEVTASALMAPSLRTRLAEIDAARTAQDWPRLLTLAQEWPGPADARPPQVQMAEGIALRGLSRIDEAEAHFRAITERLPHLPHAWRLLAEMVMTRGDLTQAESLLQTCLDRFPGPTQVATLSLLARLRHQQDRLDEARQIFSDLCRDYPADLAGWRGLAEMASRARDYAAAAAAWRHCIDTFPDRQTTLWWRHLILALKVLGDEEKLSAALAQVQQAFPDFSSTALVGNMDPYASEDIRNMIAQAERALAAATPQTPAENLFEWVRILPQAGRNSAMDAVFQTISTLWPKSRLMSAPPQDRKGALNLWMWQAEYLLRRDRAAEVIPFLEGFPPTAPMAARIQEYRLVSTRMMGQQSADREAGAQAMRSRPEFETWETGLVWRAPGGSDRVIFVFSGGGGVMWLNMETLHKVLSQLGCHLVYMRDQSPSMYLDDPAALQSGVSPLKHRMEEIRADLGASRVMCMGTSMGGYGALRLGVLLRAEAVLTFGGVTLLETLAGTYEQQAALRRIRAAHPGIRLNIADLMATGHVPQRVTLCFGADHTMDRTQAESLAGLPGVRLLALPNFADHSVMRWFLQNRSLLHLTRAALLGQAVPDAPPELAALLDSAAPALPPAKDIA